MEEVKSTNNQLEQNAENNLFSYLEDMKEHDLNTEQLQELHELLVNTALGYLADKGIKSVEEIYLTAQNLQVSVECKEWTPFTDSSLVLCGFEDDERKIIGESH